ncbi:hypothetical protein [Sphingomonas sp. 10B4]|uniref:hypothetical protein n=1 Tax=Sphingomonas sp. 10B4 TaxID=3048575 RepID=UPI002B23E140|nr:hypothetical protein [Sphingomonas sp. 10B4]
MQWANIENDAEQNAEDRVETGKYVGDQYPAYRSAVSTIDRIDIATPNAFVDLFVSKAGIRIWRY